MAVVVYNDVGIIPGPLVSITDEPILAGNQERIGTTYRLTLTGKLVNYKGSPASTPYAGGSPSTNFGGFNNQFWIVSGQPPDETNPGDQLIQLGQILRKQEALRNLFSIEGAWLEFTPWDGSQVLKCQPKSIAINFSEAIWFNTCDYTITAECDVLYLNGQILNANIVSDLIQSSAESWEIQPDEVVKTFQVSHTISAVGKRVFNDLGQEVKPAWKTAEAFVNNQLVRGWNGTSPISQTPGSLIFGESYLGSGSLNFTNYSPFNYSQSEAIDELAGSYSCTERWLAAPNLSGTHIYSINTRTIVDDGYTNVVSSINGTIKGFYVNLFAYDQRLAAADYAWTVQIGGVNGLLNLILSNFANTGITYNNQPRAGAIDYNYNEGSINYQYEFSNTLYHQDAYEQWTISRKTSADNYLTTFGVAGNVKGRRYDGDVNPLISFQRAYNYFTTLSGNNYAALYDRVISSTYFPEASTMGVQVAPVSKSIDINEAEGVISYQVEFNNRRNDAGVPANNVIETYQINRHYSLDDGIYTYSLQGEIQGLNIVDINPQQAKFAAASGYYYGTVVPNAYNRVANYYGVSLPFTTPFVTEVGLFPLVGQVTYSYEFRSIFGPMLPGVLSEHINVSEVNYNQYIKVIAKISIPGRTQGEILQDVNTSIAKVRTVNVEAVVPPTGDLGGNILVAFNTKPSYDSIILQLAPANSYIVNWQDGWDWRYGRYTLTAEFLYE